MSRKLLFLGCNHNQVSYLNILRKQNWFIVGVDINSNAPGKKLCDSFYRTGYDNLPELIEIGKKGNFVHKDKIFTAASQFAHKGAAHFASYFNITYPSEKSIDICLDKFSFYRFFQKNDIPTPPTWYLNNEKELRDLIYNFVGRKLFYLKSDYSKNPNYVYQFDSESVPYSEICWKHDRYFRKHYILQEEFIGEHLRLNIYGNRYNVFKYHTNELTQEYHDKLESIGIIKTLKILLNTLGLEKWLVKFDIILFGEKYVVLDIGLDPPFRMKAESKKQKLVFEKYYLEHYLSGNIVYPASLD